MAAQTYDVAVLLSGLDKVFVYLGVQAVGKDSPPAGIGIEIAHFLFDLIKVHRRQQFAGTAGDSLTSLQDDFLQVFGEAPGGLAHHAGEVGDGRIRECQIFALLYNVLRGQVVLGHKDRQIADCLGGRCDLDNLAQHIIDLTVILFDFRKSSAKAHTLDLGFQVGVLTAGDLISVNISGG